MGRGDRRLFSVEEFFSGSCRGVRAGTKPGLQSSERWFEICIHSIKQPAERSLQTQTTARYQSLFEMSGVRRDAGARRNQCFDCCLGQDEFTLVQNGSKNKAGAGYNIVNPKAVCAASKTLSRHEGMRILFCQLTQPDATVPGIHLLSALFRPRRWKLHGAQM